MAIPDNEITVRLARLSYGRLLALARASGRTPESVTRELIERALRATELDPAPSAPAGRTAVHAVLAAAGRLRELSPALRQRITPGVTLDEVQAALDEAEGPSLSELVLEQRRAQP